MLLMASTEIENVIEADRLMYFESKMLVQELLDKFGKEYYKDKQYVLYMKESNKYRNIL